MAEIPVVKTSLDRTTIFNITDKITRLIELDCLCDIKEIFEPLQPSHCAQILCNTIDQIIPLTSAVMHSRVEISRYLLKLSLRQGRRAMSEYWQTVHHPLAAAMHTNKLVLIRMISKNLYNINEYTTGPYTPLMHAIFSGNLEYVKVMVRLGADINRACFYGSTPLMASVKNRYICHHLVTLGVDLDPQDKDGNTALHIAVNLLSIDCVRILLDAGADVKIRNKDGVTPLILASLKMHCPLVATLGLHAGYSELDNIEALEALGASFACAGIPQISHLIRALEMRKYKYDKRIACEDNVDYTFGREYLCESELKNLKDDPLKLSYQGILIIDRLNGKDNSIYIKCLLQTALIATVRKQLVESRYLIDYIENNYSSSSMLIAACSKYFKELFNEVFADRNPTTFFSKGGLVLFRTIARATGQMWLQLMDEIYTTPFIENCPYIELVDTFLFMASSITSMSVSVKTREQVIYVIVHLIQLNPRFIAQESLLHRAIKTDKILPGYEAHFIRVLLSAGARVDAKDALKRTPLMYALTYSSNDVLGNIVEVLKLCGCNLNCRDNEGFSATDYKRWIILSGHSVIPPNLQSPATDKNLNYSVRYGRILQIMSVDPST